MKKTYIIPEIECEEMIGEELLQMSQISTQEATGAALSKERETVDFSDDESIW